MKIWTTLCKKDENLLVILFRQDFEVILSPTQDLLSIQNPLLAASITQQFDIKYTVYCILYIYTYRSTLGAWGHPSSP